ncbi:TfoX/Sxy family protein [Modestobacter italicus]|uniref:TfoX/Sxy family protein n=1 Tax=Modestobacter italicus (strain DSM 44449 / CECT 9708 / BC 501) TaxID=2732864 RepID=UPI001C962844|nr:TfoX/Sxy family protein [Modestobacter italicus]
MTYDRELADRVRAALSTAPDVSEKAMFGGLAFLVGGAMAVAVSGQGGLMVRSDPARADELTAAEGVERMVMRGRALDGWLLVAAEALDDEETLRRWVATGRDVARTLPATPGRRRAGSTRTG